MLGSCITANIGFGLQLLNVRYSTNESSHQINHSFFSELTRLDNEQPVNLLQVLLTLLDLHQAQ